MKTIKLPVEFNDSINEDIRVYSSVVRFSYNRFLDGYNQTQVYRLCCQTFHIGTHLITSAMRQAKALYSRFKDGGIQFGDFKRRSKLLISSEEYKKSKLLGMTSEGETPHKGNRHFDFDIENEVIVYKRSKNEHIALKLPKLKKKVKDELLIVQEGMKSKLLPVTLKLHKNQIYIIFDESKLSKSKRLEGLMSNRIMGIDLNPNYIGLSILEFVKDDNFKVLKKMVYDLSSLNAHFNKFKKHHELREINHKIIRLCKHYKVSKIAVEDLSIKSSDKHKGRNYNKLCNNEWNRSITVPNLRLLCSTYGIDFEEVNPAYSSFVGNLEYGDENTPDMVAASIEIGRRGYHKYLKGWFYPDFNAEKLKSKFHQWKEEIWFDVENWVQLFKRIKEPEMRYRFQLDEKRCLQTIYHKMNITAYFYI